MERHFEIMMRVEFLGRTFEQRRSTENSIICNHYDNIPAAADYMAREIQKQIHDWHWVKNDKETKA